MPSGDRRRRDRRARHQHRLERRRWPSHRPGVRRARRWRRRAPRSRSASTAAAWSTPRSCRRRSTTRPASGRRSRHDAPRSRCTPTAALAARRQSCMRSPDGHAASMRRRAWARGLVVCADAAARAEARRWLASSACRVPAGQQLACAAGGGLVARLALHANSCVEGRGAATAAPPRSLLAHGAAVAGRRLSGAAPGRRASRLPARRCIDLLAADLQLRLRARWHDRRSLL